MHKKYKFLITFVLICSITFTSYAEELNDLKDHRSEIQVQIDESNTELSNIDGELTENLQQVQKLDENIQISEKNLEELNKEISRDARRNCKCK